LRKTQSQKHFLDFVFSQGIEKNSATHIISEKEKQSSLEVVGFFDPLKHYYSYYLFFFLKFQRSFAKKPKQNAKQFSFPNSQQFVSKEMVPNSDFSLLI